MLVGDDKFSPKKGKSVLMDSVASQITNKMWTDGALLEALFARVIVVDSNSQIVRSFGRAEDLADDEVVDKLSQEIAQALMGEEQLRRLDLSGHAGGRSVTVRLAPLKSVCGVIQAVAIALDRRSQVTDAVQPAVGNVRRMEFVLENIRHGFWRLDREGRIVLANQHMADWIETSQKELVGQPASRYLVSHSIPELKLGAAHRYEAEFQSESGIVRRALVDQMPEPDCVHGTTFALITDLTAESAVRATLVAELQRVASLARQDHLTGLLNRRAFAQLLEAAVESAEDRPFGVMLVDVDHLKEINDAHGHEAGDRAIVAVAERLRKTLRDKDTIARVGGDELAVMVQGVDRSSFQELARRVQRQLYVEVPNHEPALTVTASVGAAYSLDGTAHLMRAADSAMYLCKKRRRR